MSSLFTLAYTYALGTVFCYEKLRGFFEPTQPTLPGSEYGTFVSFFTIVILPVRHLCLNPFILSANVV